MAQAASLALWGGQRTGIGMAGALLGEGNCTKDWDCCELSASWFTPFLQRLCKVSQFVHSHSCIPIDFVTFEHSNDVVLEILQSYGHVKPSQWIMQAYTSGITVNNIVILYKATLSAYLWSQHLALCKFLEEKHFTPARSWPWPAGQVPLKTRQGMSTARFTACRSVITCTPCVW